MKSLKRNPKLSYLALAVALSFGAASEAAGAARDGYKFEVVSQPTETSLTLRLVNSASEQPVADAHVFAIRRQWLATKGQPQFLDRRVELMPVGNGTFIYEGDDVQPGATIRLVLQIDDSDSDVVGSINVGK